MLLILRELKEVLDEGLKNLKVRKKSNKEEYTTIPVYLWDVPKTKGIVNEYPYILLQGFKGQVADDSVTGLDEKEVNVRFYIAVYNDEKDEDVAQSCGEDVSNVINRIIRTIRKPDFIEGYALQYPVDYDIGIPGESNFQPLPYGIGQIMTMWKRLEVKKGGGD